MKSLQGVAGQQDGLSQLTAISRWQITRLEEEAIDNVSALAAADPCALHISTPFKENVLNFWIDAARLAALVGSAKYEKLRDDCLTGSEFIRRSQEPEFVGLLKESHQIGNPDEIARLLQESFATAPPPAA